MDNSQWLVKVREHSGQTLAVRLRPSAAISDVDRAYGYLLVVTQRLECVDSRGMPTTEHNRNLFGFDRELIRELDDNGRVVVVETHAGKRIYYAYVADEAAAKARATRVLAAYNNLGECAFRGGPDPEWTFYSRYVALDV